MSTLLNLMDKTTGITCDSRTTNPGDIFVAIRGRTIDGNLFVSEAVKRGALAVITDCPQPLSLPVPVFTVPDARHSLATLAARFYHHPSHQMAVMGVTGTNGKTTITYMLEHIFRQAGFNPGLIGTLLVNVGKSSYSSKLTTPDAVSLQHYLAEMHHNSVTHVAIEVSAQGMEMHRVDGVRFSCGVVSNISPDHLDFHGDFPNYIAAKQRFLYLLPTSAPLVINIGDPYCQAMLKGFSGPVITTAVNSPADISASILSTSSCGSKFQLRLNRSLGDLNGHIHQPGNIEMHLPIPGCHNIENAALAAAAALLHGIPFHTIAAALANFASVERRMNILHVNGLTVVDDTALNPGSINAVFTTLTDFRYRRLIVVNAIRGQRGPAINQANAVAIAQWQEELGFALIVTASDAHVDSANRVTLEEKSAFSNTLELRQSNYTYCANLKEAIAIALDHAHSGDLIALLGAQGMDEGRSLLLSLTTAYSKPEPVTSTESLIAFGS